MSLRASLLALLLVLAAPLAWSSGPLVFADAAQEARFHALASELRCVQCHNQSLADSDALIAQDMRRQVLELIQRGYSDDQVRDFLVQRYGEFVLYRPALGGHTWLLWWGPGMLLLAGGAVLWRTVRRRTQQLAGVADNNGDDGAGPSW